MPAAACDQEKICEALLQPLLVVRISTGMNPQLQCTQHQDKMDDTGKKELRHRKHRFSMYVVAENEHKNTRHRFSMYVLAENKHKSTRHRFSILQQRISSTNITSALVFCVRQPASNGKARPHDAIAGCRKQQPEHAIAIIQDEIARICNKLNIECNSQNMHQLEEAMARMQDAMARICNREKKRWNSWDMQWLEHAMARISINQNMKWLQDMT